MRVAVISDIHVMSPSEKEKTRASVHAIGNDSSALSRNWRRGLYRVRRKLWHGDPDLRLACFRRALKEMEAFRPDWLIANGDYGGDTAGVGLSDESTFESAASVVNLIREGFGDRCRFIFGDHELGKYGTNIRQGGIRLESLYRGEEKLGIKSFWHEVHHDFHLIGINSSLFTLDLFLPEALEDEVPAWKRHRESHFQKVVETFESLPRKARILLFCHDPSALSVVAELPAIQKRMDNIACTILGHLHSPLLLKLAKMVPNLPRWNLKYPVARIITHSLREVRSWEAFNPILCPSTSGTGDHFSGGILFLETNPLGDILIRQHQLKASLQKTVEA